MLIIQARGGLGNQMFQYAFGMNLSQKLGCKFLMNRNDLTEIKAFYLSHYFSLDAYHHLMTSKNYLLGKLHDGFVARMVPRLKCMEEGKDDLKIVSNGLYLKGFFQSDLFFKESQSKIKEVFRVKRHYLEEFFEKHGSKMAVDMAVVHLRLGDYKEFGSDKLGGKNMTLPFSYYERNIEYLEKNHNVKQFIFVSDDIAEVKTHFGSDDRFIYNEGSVIEDFLLIRQAKNLIISNSTFAWWAAYLSEVSPLVIAPKYWLGFKVKRPYPEMIMTDQFIWKDV